MFDVRIFRFERDQWMEASEPIKVSVQDNLRSWAQRDASEKTLKMIACWNRDAALDNPLLA